MQSSWIWLGTQLIIQNYPPECLKAFINCIWQKKNSLFHPWYYVTLAGTWVVNLVGIVQTTASPCIYHSWPRRISPMNVSIMCWRDISKEFFMNITNAQHLCPVGTKADDPFFFPMVFWWQQLMFDAAWRQPDGRNCAFTIDDFHPLRHESITRELYLCNSLYKIAM